MTRREIHETVERVLLALGWEPRVSGRLEARGPIAVLPGTSAADEARLRAALVRR